MADNALYAAVSPTRASAPIALGATSMTVAAIKDRLDNTLTMADFGSKGYGVISPGKEKEEQFVFTGISGNTVTGISWVTMKAPYTETSGFAESHAAGERVVLYTNSPAFYNSFLNKNNDEMIAGTYTFPSAALPIFDSHPTFTDDKHLIDKKYADDLAIAGAPDGADAVKGLFEAATQTESDEGDDTGSTTAPTVLRPSKAANTVQRGAWLEFTETASGDDAYTATTTPTFVPEEGTIVNGTFATANTGACTFALNAAAAADIKKYASGTLADPETGDIVASQPVILRKTGANWVLMNPGATMPTTALLSEMAAVFAATDATGAELETLTDGSNAGAKHYHIASESDATLFATGTIHLPMILDDSTLVYGGANTAGSEIWSLPASIYMVTGTNGSNYGSVRTDGVGKVASSSGNDGLFYSTTGQTGDINLSTVWTSIIRFRLNTLPSSTDTFFIGFAEDADTLDASGDSPTTSLHIGYQYHGAGTTWRVTTGDNTTQQVSNVATPSAGWHELKIVRGASDVKVYLDGTLLATHATNIPTQGEMIFYAAYNNGSGATSQTEILRHIDFYAATT